MCHTVKKRLQDSEVDVKSCKPWIFDLVLYHQNVQQGNCYIQVIGGFGAVVVS